MQGCVRKSEREALEEEERGGEEARSRREWRRGAPRGKLLREGNNVSGGKVRTVIRSIVNYYTVSCCVVVDIEHTQCRMQTHQQRSIPSDSGCSVKASNT